MASRTDSVARYRAAFAERNLVHEIEALVARAWPPLTILDLDGWQLRSAGGLTRRANSVWPRAAGTRLPLGVRLRQAEGFYVSGGLDPTVQLSPSARPTGLEAALLQRGYRASGAEVRVRRVDGLAGLAGTGDGAGSGAGERSLGLVGAAAWLPAWAAAAGTSARAVTMAERILQRVALDCAFAVVTEGSEVAVARGVADAGWLGIDLLAATPPLRTRAVGAVLLAALAGWGAARGLEQAHVEVADTDEAALAMLAGAGFRRAYALRYLTKPRTLVTGS